jgi:hypothetical protein
MEPADLAALRADADAKYATYRADIDNRAAYNAYLDADVKWIEAVYTTNRNQ